MKKTIRYILYPIVYRIRNIPDKAMDVQRPDVLVVSRPDHKNDNIHIYVIGTEGNC